MQQYVLVPIIYVMIERGWCEIDAMRAIDEGRIVWVWDIGLGGARRELRAWRRELHDPAARDLPPEQVVDQIIGVHRPRLRASEIRRILSCSTQHLTALLRAGELQLVGLAPDGRWISRDSFADFLRRRLLA